MSDLIQPRSRYRIRDEALARLVQRFAANVSATPLAIEEDSDAYAQVDALAVLLALLESDAADAPNHFAPDRAVGSWLARHGDSIGLLRQSTEDATDYKARVLEHFALTIGAGSGFDFTDLFNRVDGIEESYAYERLQPGSTTTTLGCMTCVLVGPAQGNSTTNTRIVGAGTLTNARNYLAGTHDETGAAITTGIPRRPLAAPIGAAASIEVEAAAVSSQDVDLQVANDSLHEPPWTPVTGIALVGATADILTVAGDHTDKLGKAVLAFVGTGVKRGGYQKAVVASVAVAGPNTDLVLDRTLGAAPTGSIYPALPNWEAIRDEVFEYFDQLGPGTGIAASRYPTENESGRATLKRDELTGRLTDVYGVIACGLATPAVDVTPAAKTIVTLGILLIRST